MKYFATILLTLSTTPLLIACNDDSGNSMSGLELKEFYVRSRTNDDAYLKHRSEEQAEFYFTNQYHVVVEAPSGLDSVEVIEVNRPNASNWNTIHDTSVDSEDDAYRDAQNSDGSFNSINYFSTGTDSETRDLEGYRVRIITSEGLAETFDVDAQLPESLADQDPTFLYSHEYDGNTAGGLEGLAIGTVDNITFDPGNDDFSAHVSIQDERAETAYIAFYDDNQAYLGATRYFGVSNDDFTNDGQPTEVTTDFSDSSEFGTYLDRDINDATQVLMFMFGPRVSSETMDFPPSPITSVAGYVDLP